MKAKDKVILMCLEALSNQTVMPKDNEMERSHRHSHKYGVRKGKII